MDLVSQEKQRSSRCESSHCLKLIKTAVFCLSSFSVGFMVVLPESFILYTLAGVTGCVYVSPELELAGVYAGS